MSSFISVPSISQSATRIADQIEPHLESPYLESFEIRQQINRALARIRLQPMADIFVVQGQLAENLFLAGLQFGEELFELCYVEDITGSDRTGGAQLSFASRRNSSEDHFAEMILRAFLNTHRIGNSVRTIVKRRNWSDLGLQVAAMGVLFTNAVPTCFDLYAIGDTAALDPEQRGGVADGIQIEAGWDRVREEYAHRGYLEAKVAPVPSFDDRAHTVSYSVSIQEGSQYHFGKMILTGISPAGERKLRAACPITAGDIFDI